MESASGAELALQVNKKEVLYVTAEGMSQLSRVLTADIETCIGVMHIVTTPLVPDSDRDPPRVPSDSRAVRAGEPAVAPASSGTAGLPEVSAERSGTGAHPCHI